MGERGRRGGERGKGKGLPARRFDADKLRVLARAPSPIREHDMELLAAADTRFPTDYGDARARFRRAAEAAGGRLRGYRNPTSGPAGEELACHCAWFGPGDAGKAVAIMSGTHGVEGVSGAS